MDSKHKSRTKRTSTELPSQFAKGRKEPLTDKFDAQKLSEYSRLLAYYNVDSVVDKIRNFPDDICYVIELLRNNQNNNVRFNAACALGKIKDAGAVPALIDALKDEDGRVRYHTVQALVNIGKPAVPVLIDALKDKDANVRQYAAQALENIAKTNHEARKAIVAAFQAFLDTKEFHAELSRNSTLYVKWFGHYDGIIKKVGEAENRDANAGAVK